MSFKYIIDGTLDSSYKEISTKLFEIINPIYKEERPIIFLCIGTDRSSGDSLGPLIGYKLDIPKGYNIYCYGSLEKPLHSLNLEEIIIKIKLSFKNPFIIAIDASLGEFNNVGKVIIQDSPLNPGLALKKNLPAIGDISLTGIVNFSGNFEFMILQNTRLYTVMLLADSISAGITSCIYKVVKSNLEFTL